MRNKIQKYLSGEREGFSLVELIIVIAIMAILIGIVALAVIPYLEKSRVGKDQQTVDTVYSAFKNEIASQQITESTTVTISSSGGSLTTKGSVFDVDKLAEALDCTDADGLAALEKKLSSSGIKDQDIVCSFDSSTKEIKAEVTNAEEGGDNIKSSNK
ncbi:MAG: prepilin-type N-terminal cleavage/methylation domain-containing protein [Eubacterium sp.]|nr:prepilin-type N-terminal cleavage/methylation domain-containing protein [Eubacterium sp.]